MVRMKGKPVMELRKQNVEWIKQGNWKDDPYISRIPTRSKDKIEMFFELHEPKYMTQSFVIWGIHLESVTVYKLIRVMLEYGVLEKIETTTYPFFRLRRK